MSRVSSMLWVPAVTALLCAASVASEQNFTNLCTCTDLLWKAEPSHAWEVVNWHSKLVAELNTAQSKGVSSFSFSQLNGMQSWEV